MNFAGTYQKHAVTIWLALAIFAGMLRSITAQTSDDVPNKSGLRSPADSNQRSPEKTSKQYISVKAFGALCDGISDDAPAVQKAVDATSWLLFPKGTCFLNSTVTLKNGTQLRGEGINVSIVRQGSVSGASMGTFFVNSGSAEEKVTNIRISDMTIYGQSDVLGFSQFQHLISLNGVKNALVDHVEFRGFRGDGVYLGSGNIGGDERHNENVTIRDSLFDGVNHSNRNGISIIDGNGILIENNRFINTTQPKMPGAIDIEPNDNSFHLIANINIRDNKFISIGGNVAAISFVLNSLLATVPSLFRVERNSITGTSGGILFLTRTKPTATSQPNRLLIANNIVTTAGRSFVISGAKDFRISENTFSDANSSSLIGYKAEADKCMNGIISKNIFKDIKRVGITIFSIDHLEISKNQFIDVGNGGIGSYAIDFNFGTSSFVSLLDNIVSSPTGKTAYAIHKEMSHTFFPATNTERNNRFIGVSGDAFQAFNSQ